MLDLLLIRQLPGAAQWDPGDPASGLFAFPPVAEGYPEIPIKIQNAGYSSAGAPHEIRIWLQPAGAVVPGGPEIEIARVASGNAVAFLAGCVPPVPRDEVSSWTLRVQSVGKTGLSTVAIYFNQSGLTA